MVHLLFKILVDFEATIEVVCMLDVILKVPNEVLAKLFQARRIIEGYLSNLHGWLSSDVSHVEGFRTIELRSN